MRQQHRDAAFTEYVAAKGPWHCELSVDETAVALSCSAGTVKSQTARGLKALRRAMELSTAVPGGPPGSAEFAKARDVCEGVPL